MKQIIYLYFLSVRPTCFDFASINTPKENFYKSYVLEKVLNEDIPFLKWDRKYKKEVSWDNFQRTLQRKHDWQLWDFFDGLHRNSHSLLVRL